MTNKFAKCLIFVFKIPKDNKDGCRRDYEHREYNTNKRWLIHNLNQQEVGKVLTF